MSEGIHMARDYGYPFDRATKVALRTVREVLAREPRLTQVVLCFFSEGDLAAARELAAESSTP